MSQIKIPPRLSAKLAEDPAMRAMVDSNLGPFTRWFEVSRTPFFPDFTDHGPDHVQGVLETASSLIRDEAWERDVFTSADAGILVLATLLHDCAMHLTEAGFLALVAADSAWRPLPGLGDKPWSALWEEFLGEASRFDGRTLTHVFGKPHPVHRPPVDPADWTDTHKRLIGEFLRRHHPRLAHEIAMFGVPGPEGERIGLKNAPRDNADLAGVVARSHGLALRIGADYLQSQYRDPREYKHIHAVFLMGVLRVSDYLQVQAERAPQEKLQVTELLSPIAKEEFQKHHAIRDVRFTHRDPEAVYVDAQPSNIKTYLGVKSWLQDIQKELDASWAAFGEVYGEHAKLNALGMAIRRVRSNLDNTEEFAKTVVYVPCHATFDTADAELLKLLVGPLYEEKAEIGIRELVQNAVDAVNELRYVRQHACDLVEDEPCAQTADVKVNLERTVSSDGEEYWLVVSDRGIGMTADIIKKYFLRAGATYRKSAAWQKQFESESGSQILRSGRFGVGVLAAFLLGDKIHVTTRHAECGAADGIEFTATIDSEAIELRKCTRSIGTTISIKVSRAIVEQLTKVRNEWDVLGNEWDWFCMDRPTVERHVFDQEEPLRQKHVLPGPLVDLPYDWRRLVDVDYLDVQWSYPDISSAPSVVCNGIVVDKLRFRTFHKTYYPCFAQPCLSVYDPDGNLPVNLQRTALSSSASALLEKINREVVRDFIAYCLVFAPDAIDLLERWFLRPGYEGLYPRSRDVWSCICAPFFLSESGFALSDHTLLIEGWEGNSIVFVPHPADAAPRNAQLECYAKGLTANFLLKSGVMACDEWTRLMIVEDARDVALGPYRLLRPGGRRLLVSAHQAKRIQQRRKIPQYQLKHIIRNKINENYELWELGRCGVPRVDFEGVAKEPAPISDPSYKMYAEWYFNEPPAALEASVDGKVWLETIGGVFIPYSKTDRELQLAAVFSRLAPFIDQYVCRDEGRRGRISKSLPQANGERNEFVEENGHL